MKKHLSSLGVAGALVVFATTCLAQEPRSQLDILRQLHQLAEAKRTAELLKNLINNATVDKKVACVMAFDSIKFCSCIADISSVGLDFYRYINIVTQSREELHYNEMSADNQQLVDLTYATREHCVQASQH